MSNRKLYDLHLRRPTPRFFKLQKEREDYIQFAWAGLLMLVIMLLPLAAVVFVSINR
jgi:hypothetical protein